MSKTYVVKENSGCGCGTLLVAVLICQLSEALCHI